jgi:ribosomal protein S18 acetylase RimI-like enzyme
MHATLEPLTENDFAPLTALARQIWHQHYVGIVGPEQLDYMLGMRNTPASLRRYFAADGAWYRLLKLHGELIGYCSYALTATPGEMKLEQLYLRADHKGAGLGGLMLRHVQAEARARGCTTLMLQVNKGNPVSIAIYRKFGFGVRQEAVFDIGQGYVMDDYVMELRL